MTIVAQPLRAGPKMWPVVRPGGDRLEVRERPQDWQRFAAQLPTRSRPTSRRVVRGKHGEIRLALVALIAEGHLLIEDVPGVGKTMLAKAIARSIDCSFRRIQFTPDLLPTDVTGVNVFNQEQRRLRVQAGRDLRQHRAGRRDQPRLPEDAVGAAGVHGGATGHRRHRDPSARDPVHGHRHAEPDRARGHVSRSPRRSSTGSCSGCRSATRRPRSRAEILASHSSGDAARPTSARSPTRPASPR